MGRGRVPPKSLQNKRRSYLSEKLKTTAGDSKRKTKTEKRSKKLIKEKGAQKLSIGKKK